MAYYIQMFLFFIMPFAAALYMWHRINVYTALKKQARDIPGSVSPEELKKSRRYIFLAAVPAFLPLITIITLIMLISMGAIAFM